MADGARRQPCARIFTPGIVDAKLEFIEHFFVALAAYIRNIFVW